MQQDMLAKQAKENMRYSGFVAQEVEKLPKNYNMISSGVDAPKTIRIFMDCVTQILLFLL